MKLALRPLIHRAFVASLIFASPFVGAAPKTPPPPPTESVELSQKQIDRAIAKLLAFRDRPTISDILRALGGRVSGNPFLEAFIASRDEMHSYYAQIADTKRRSIVTATAKSVPNQIAALERAFPSARFAPLGRDAAPYGDVLDAFYVSIGQYDRLARVNGSGSTIRTADQKDLVRMMRSIGFDVAKGAEQRPLLLMDRTGYTSKGRWSQTGLIVGAIYDTYRKKYNKDAAELAAVFNVVGLSSDGLKLTDPRRNFDRFFSLSAKQANEFEGYSNGIPGDILTIPNAGAFIDHGLWHQGYSMLVRRRNGRFEGAPSSPVARPDRLAILAEMYAVFQVVSKPSFLEAVKAKARRFGYEFPVNDAIEESRPMRCEDILTQSISENAGN